MRPKSPVRGDRPNGNSSGTTPRRPGGYQNRNGLPQYDNRQASFRPPRQQPPPQSSWTNGPDPATGPYAPYSSTWGNMPPRMHASNVGPHPEPPFAMNRMTAEINAVHNGLYQPSGQEARFLAPTPPDVWTSQGYQPYPTPRQQPMPRFQQHSSSMDQDFSPAGFRQPDHSFYPPYPYQTPPVMQGAFTGHPNPTSFVYPGNGQYNNNTHAPTGHEGFPENGSHRGYQQWPQ